MSMQASTVRLLDAANFSGPQAFALAQAIDAEVHSVELLTVPIFNARMGELDKRMDGFDARMKEMKTEVKLQISESENRTFAKMAAFALTTTGIVITAVFFMVMNLKK